MSRLIPLLSLLAALSSVHAGDWPRFRGPNADGTSNARNVPLAWNADENVVWRTELEGDGWSSPILFDGRLYLTAAVPPPDAEKGSKARSLRTTAFDAADGRRLWDVEVFSQTDESAGRVHNKNSHASPSAVTDGERLYVHFGRHGTACLSFDGEILWRNTDLVYNQVHGTGPSPVLVDDKLFVNCDGGDRQFVVALDRATGRIVWRRERPPVERQTFAFSTACVIEVDGRTQIVSPAAQQVIAYDPDDGSEIWRVQYNGYSVIPKPVHANGLVFLATSYGPTKFLAIDPTGSGDVTDTHVVWSINRAAPHTPSAVAVGNEVYLISDRGIATCLDARTGEVHWQERIGGNFSSSPTAVLGDDRPRLYFTDEAGKTTVVKADTTFEVLAENDLGERTLASFAVDDGALFVRTAAALYRIGE